MVSTSERTRDCPELVEGSETALRLTKLLLCELPDKLPGSLSEVEDCSTPATPFDFDRGDRILSVCASEKLPVSLSGGEDCPAPSTHVDYAQCDDACSFFKLG
jgi:hypothetical protein